MTEAIWRGALFGAGLALFVGPVFFALLQASIERGKTSGYVLALGIFCSDALFMLLAYFGVSSIMTTLRQNPAWGVAGGTVLVAIGTYTVLRPGQARGHTSLASEAVGLLGQFGKGFMVNVLNPSTLLFWFGLVGTVTVSYDFDKAQLFVFFLTTVLTILAFDIVKVMLAVRLRRLMRERTVRLLRICIGLVMAGFGLYVAIRYGAMMG